MLCALFDNFTRGCGSPLPKIHSITRIKMTLQSPKLRFHSVASPGARITSG